MFVFHFVCMFTTGLHSLCKLPRILNSELCKVPDFVDPALNSFSFDGSTNSEISFSLMSVLGINNLYLSTNYNL
jgi:hypothetical protein